MCKKDVKLLNNSNEKIVCIFKEEVDSNIKVVGCIDWLNDICDMKFRNKCVTLLSIEENKLQFI